MHDPTNKQLVKFSKSLRRSVSAFLGGRRSFVSNSSASNVLPASYVLNGHGLYDTHIMQYVY
jgi:hypothetical protein